MSQYSKFYLGTGAAPIEKITADAGVVVLPDGTGGITVAGGNNITTTGTANTLTIDVTGTTQYAVQVGDATGSLDSLALGLDHTFLRGNTGGNPSWNAVDLTTEVTGLLPVGSGGTGLGTVTDHAVMVGSGTANVTPIGPGTDGQILIGVSTPAAGDPVWATPTNGTNITWTGGAGTLQADLTATIAVSLGGTGATTLPDHATLLGSGTGAITAVGPGTNGQLLIGANTGGDPVWASLGSARDITVTEGDGSLSIDFEADTYVAAIDTTNGVVLEEIDVDVTSDGATITCSVQKVGGGDLTVSFSDGFYDWDCTPADTVTLTAGTDTAPQTNYVYLDQGTKTLTANTTGMPATEIAPITKVICQSAASLQTKKAYAVHGCYGTAIDSTSKGLDSNITCWIRRQHANWFSGVAPTLTITPNGGAPDNVIFTSTAGVVLQMERKTFPAFTGTPDVYTVNDATTPYNIVTDLNALLTDSAGVSMSGRYFTLVIWGVQSEDSADCKLMVNLPGGSYANQALLLADAQKYANFTIPSDFKGTGFLIYQMNLRHSVAAGGTWTSISEIDLRGLEPSISPSGATAAQTEFQDNTFRILDDGDNTKELAFQVSGVTTGTTRTITMDDRDIDMDAVPTTFATDGAAATPAAGSVTISGGANITTAGAGAAVTVNLDAAVSGLTSITMANGGLLQTTTTAGQTALLAAYDTGGASYTTFGTLTAGNPPTFDLATGVTIGTAYIYRVGGTDVSVSDGGTGTSSLTDHSVLVGSGTGAITPITVGGTGELLVGVTGADPAFGTSADGNFTFTTATSGTDRILAVTNTDNTGAAASHTHLHIQTNSASAGDPYIRFDVSGGQDYSLGVDNSASDALLITDDTNPSTGNTLWKMTSAGERTMPLQPAFMAYNSATDANVTGNNTNFKVEFDTERYDQGGDYNNTTDTFTAPITARYELSTHVSVSGMVATTRGLFQIITSNATYRVCIVDVGISNGGFAIEGGTVVCDMDAADTATFVVSLSGGTKTATVGGGSSIATFIGGKLDC